MVSLCVKYSIVVRNQSQRENNKRSEERSRWIRCVSKSISFLSSIPIFFNASVEDKFNENSSFVANLRLPVEWTFSQHYFQLLFSYWKHCFLYAAVMWKPRSMQVFHSNPVACDRLKMKGYKSLPGWLWGLATVILMVWIQRKTFVAWHTDIFSVFFHCEVSNTEEIWLK